MSRNAPPLPAQLRRRPNCVASVLVSQASSRSSNSCTPPGTSCWARVTADQHVVDAGQDRGGERAERLFGAAAGAQAVELGLEIAGLLAGGGRGALHEGGLEPRGPLAHPSRSALAGALVVFRAQAGPGDQVPGGRKAAHVAADFGQD